MLITGFRGHTGFLLQSYLESRQVQPVRQGQHIGYSIDQISAAGRALKAFERKVHFSLTREYKLYLDGEMLTYTYKTGAETTIPAKKPKDALTEKLNHHIDFPQFNPASNRERSDE